MNETAPHRSRHTQQMTTLAAVGGLFLLLVVAAWLRVEYVRSANLHVDEFTSLWAAQQVREHGAPIMPSGVLYTRGLLYTWLLAGAELLFGAGRATAFGLGMVTGLLTILATWFVGKRSWSAPVGWLAAVGLTLLPEAIIWSSRARFYAQLQLFVLLAVWAAWESLRVAAHNRRMVWRWQIVYALALVCAIYSQEQAILLWPIIVLALLVWRGWRWLLSPPVLVAQIVVLVAIAARFVIEIAGQPGYFETIQSTRPYLGMIFDLTGAWRTYAPLLVGNGHLVWTVGALVAIAAALMTVARKHSIVRTPAEHQATLYFALPVVGILATLFLLVGTSWRDTRYLFLVQTFWLLLGAAGIVWALRWLAGLLGRPHWTAALAGSACVAMALYALSGWGALDKQEENFEQAFQIVDEQRTQASAVLSPQPPACAWVLGSPCDGYAIQRGYEEYVIPNAAGTLVDRWTGAPLIDTPEKLAEVIRAHPQTWLVSDAFRLATRYEGDYQRTILNQFARVAEEEGALVLRADGWVEQPQFDEAIVFSPTLRFGPLELVSATLVTNWDEAMTEIPVELEWRAVEPIAQQINTSLRLVNADGVLLAQSDGPPASGIIPTTLFFDQPLPDRKTLELPYDAIFGTERSRIRLEVAAYTLEPEVTPVGEVQAIWWMQPWSTQISLTPFLGGWENGITLTSAHTTTSLTNGVPPQRGETVEMSVQWFAGGPTETRQVSFMHLVASDGTVVAQDDHEVDGGFWPTTHWAETTIVDEFTFDIPADLPPGDYSVVIGWYDAASGERTLTTDGEPAIEIARWQIASQPAESQK